MKRAGPNPVALIELCDALVNKRFTRMELKEYVGIHDQTISIWLRLLRERKLIYVYEWVRRGNVPTAIWKWGHPVLDAPRPKAKTTAEYCRTYRNKLRKQGENHGSNCNLSC